jgi:hypothetical protein
LSTAHPGHFFLEDLAEADIPIWREALLAAERPLLHFSPVYYGVGVPRGDGSAVVVIPGFLKSDAYLRQLRWWLARIGYRSYFSGINHNAECPNLLLQSPLRESIARAYDETGRKLHLIGHSLGGVIARALAALNPEKVASVITLASPFRGTVAHRMVLNAAEAVRRRILEQHGSGVLPTCYTGRCTCNFVESLRSQLPESVLETAIYTRNDGIVDWRYCRTDDPETDFEVPGTHLGLVFNSDVYRIIAKRLAASR